MTMLYLHSAEYFGIQMVYFALFYQAHPMVPENRGTVREPLGDHHNMSFCLLIAYMHNSSKN